MLRVGFNRAFRSPSSINNYLDISLVNPVDLRGLAPLLPPPLQPLVAQPFPLVVERRRQRAARSASTPQAPLKQESLTACEGAYTGTFNDRTTVGLAFYVNDMDDNINFVQLPRNLDPYTPANPPPGWPLPPAILGRHGAAGDLPAANGVHVSESRAHSARRASSCRSITA